ncbi:MAG TPA: diaminopimelate epimerase [Terracidiphilus sp.]|nr:diaminopimelate epimerase [Terracidiphilus sp.]
MIPFTKAHACGNDFLIVPAGPVASLDLPALTRHLCARTTGIGADGIEYFTWIRNDGSGPAAGRIRLLNADGSLAEISGNGTRCVAAWMAREIHAQPGRELHIETDAGLRICRIDSVHAGQSAYSVQVTTGMGIPIAEPRTVRLASGLELTGIEVSTGNPHFVLRVDNPAFTLHNLAWQAVGAQLCDHPDFPNQTNVEFLRILNAGEVEIRIFERGVGPTTSSGTGTSASAAAAIAFHDCHSPLAVAAPGGVQTVSWPGPGSELHLTGPATLIAHGEAWPS